MLHLALKKKIMAAPKSLLKYDSPVVVSTHTTEKSAKVRATLYLLSTE